MGFVKGPVCLSCWNIDYCTLQGILCITFLHLHLELLPFILPRFIQWSIKRFNHRKNIDLFLISIIFYLCNFLWYWVWLSDGREGPNNGCVVLLKDDFYQSRKWKMCNCTQAIFNQQLQKKYAAIVSIQSVLLNEGQCWKVSTIKETWSCIFVDDV